jgi:hypothetical protein
VDEELQMGRDEKEDASLVLLLSGRGPQFTWKIEDPSACIYQLTLVAFGVS